MSLSNTHELTDCFTEKVAQDAVNVELLKVADKLSCVKTLHEITALPLTVRHSHMHVQHGLSSEASSIFLAKLYEKVLFPVYLKVMKWIIV